MENSLMEVNSTSFLIPVEADGRIELDKISNEKSGVQWLKSWRTASHIASCTQISERPWTSYSFLNLILLDAHYLARPFQMSSVAFNISWFKIPSTAISPVVEMEHDGFQQTFGKNSRCIWDKPCFQLPECRDAWSCFQSLTDINHVSSLFLQEWLL